MPAPWPRRDPVRMASLFHIGIDIGGTLTDCVLIGDPAADGTATYRTAKALSTKGDPADGVSANLALAEALRPVAQRYGVASAAVAIAWTRAFPGVTRRSWGPAARADRWLATDGHTGSEGGRSCRNRRGRPRHRGRDRACRACFPGGSSPSGKYQLGAARGAADDLLHAGCAYPERYQTCSWHEVAPKVLRRGWAHGHATVHA
jgi:Hydantoinase/oxoprolinase N-terminal region